MTKARAPIPEPANGADLTQLRAMWTNIDAVLSKTEDSGLQTALAAAAMKVFIAEATKLIDKLEKA